MKINSMFRVLILFTAVMIFSLPLVARTQDSVHEKAIFDGTQAAESVFNERLWYLTGCFFSFGGYLFAQTYYAPVPTVALLGRSPEYVAIYTDVYRAKSKELRSEAALEGCIHGAVAQTCLPVIGLLISNR